MSKKHLNGSIVIKIENCKNILIVNYLIYCYFLSVLMHSLVELNKKNVFIIF